MRRNDRSCDYLQKPSRRRLLTLSAGALATGLAGCTNGGLSSQNGSDENSDTDSDPSDGTPEGGARLEDFDAGDIRVGNEEQRLSLELSRTDSGGEIDIYVDATGLRDVNIGVSNLGVVAESRYSIGWLVSDAEITKGERIIVHVTVAFDDEVDIDDRGHVNIELTGLETSNGEHMDSLTYSATISTSNGEPDFAAGKTASAEVINPEQIENVLRVDPSDIRVGDTSQQVGIVIERATDEIDFRMDINPLTEMGIDVENAKVVVEESTGERRNDEGEVEIEVTDTAVVDGVVQLGITTTAFTLAVDIRITGLDTEKADVTTRMTYPVYIGERPSEPTESSRFRISGATA